MKWIYPTMEFFVCFVEVLTGILFCSEVLHCKKGISIASIAYSLVIAGGLHYLSSLSLISFIVTLYGVITIAAFIVLVNRKYVFDVVVTTAIYMSIVHFVDFTVIIIAMLLAGDTNATALVTWNSLTRLMIQVFLIVLLIICCFLLYRFLFQKLLFPLRHMFLVALMAMGSGYFLEYLLTHHFDSEGAMMAILYILNIILAIFVIIQYGQSREHMQMNAWLDERNQMMSDNYNEILANYTNNAIFYHDLKNHFLYLEQLLKDENYCDASLYMKKIYAEYRDISSYEWTGYKVIDLLLNHHKSLAEKSGIDFQITSDYIPRIPVSDQAICSLLGNALNNAREACEKTREGKKYILFTCRKINEALLLKIVNTYNPAVSSKTLTDSRNEPVHGWGLKSMQRVIEQSNAHMEQSQQDGLFTLSISLFETASKK